jgi:hypothetical protein
MARYVSRDDQRLDEAQQRLDQLPVPLFPVYSMKPEQIQALHRDFMMVEHEIPGPWLALHRDVIDLARRHHHRALRLARHLAASSEYDDHYLASYLLGPLMESARNYDARIAVQRLWIDMLVNPVSGDMAVSEMRNHRNLFDRHDLIGLVGSLAFLYQRDCIAPPSGRDQTPAY